MPLPAVQVLEGLLGEAVKTRRNYILDQTK
jgi:hypothetical protein